jgi:hypothetical protein
MMERYFEGSDGVRGEYGIPTVSESS